MIQRFHEVIEKRSILQAKAFTEGSSKLSLARKTTIETRGTECESGDLAETSPEKVLTDAEKKEESRSSNEVICESDFQADCFTATTWQ